MRRNLSKKPAQCLTVFMTIDGEPLLRHYSLTSSSIADAGPKGWIKRVAGSGITSLFKQILFGAGRTASCDLR
ncbi:hypothetical protein [uncultured Roseibium sp.]|uniref:hypothetical protein n=1 Tax=uncultured Roseibium sp. TaxID=1936171 RepID=UPI0032174D48